MCTASPYLPFSETAFFFPTSDGFCREPTANHALTYAFSNPPPPLIASLQFSIDELRRQMDKKHNIRNMSVIAHVDHVSY